MKYVNFVLILLNYNVQFPIHSIDAGKFIKALRIVTLGWTATDSNVKNLDIQFLSLILFSFSKNLVKIYYTSNQN